MTKKPLSGHKRCGKIRHATQRSAIRSAIASWFMSGGTPLRVYRCPDCSGWHLTSRKTWTKPAKKAPVPDRTPKPEQEHSLNSRLSLIRPPQ